jgi:uracil-DNA glycosylase
MSTYEQGLANFSNQLTLDWSIFFSNNDKIIKEIDNKLIQNYKNNITIYPKSTEVFNAFLLTSLKSMKVCIIGQDPYPNEAAMGLAFSHKSDNRKVQPSLKNIYKELLDEGFKIDPTSGDLTKWAKQGIFLINTSLTVEKGRANSHCKYWKDFTKELFKYISSDCDHLVVIMWGKQAESYKGLFDQTKHKFIISAHPSPLSASKGFFGSKPFTKTNELLKGWDIKEVDWNLM